MVAKKKPTVQDPFTTEKKARATRQDYGYKSGATITLSN